MICETCGKTHAGKYGSGRFCCQECARSFSSKHVTKEGREKQKEVLTDKTNRAKLHETRLSNSKNYEKDENGNWVKIPKSKKGNKKSYFENSVDQYRQSSALGKVGELITAQKFIKHGYNVYIPLLDNDGTDMIVEKDNGLKKIQVKSTASNHTDDNSSTFKLTSNEKRMKNGQVISYGKKYKKKDVDYFALYSKKDDDIYLIENDGKASSFTIRTKLDEDNLTTKGKNLEKLHMAEDYQIDRVLDDIDRGIDRSNIIEVMDFVDNSDN